MSAVEEKSQRKMFQVFIGALVVFAVFGGLIYLGKQTSPLPESSRSDSSASPDELDELSSLEEQYQEILLALSNDDIPGACDLCSTLSPLASGDPASQDSLEVKIRGLCEDARKKDLARKKEFLKAGIAKLPPEAGSRRLEGYYSILELDPEDALYQERALALEKKLLETNRKKLEELLNEKNFAQACSLCEELPMFRSISSEPLQKLCSSAVEGRRLEQIEALTKRVKPLPASDYMGNLRGYRQLAQLDPSEDTYWEKIERYTKSAQTAQARLLRRTSAIMSYDVNTGIFWYLPSIAEKRGEGRGAHAYLYVGKKDDGSPPQLRFVCLLRRETPFTPTQVVLSFGSAGYALPLREEWVHFQGGFLWCDIPLPNSGEALELIRKFAETQKGSFSFKGSGEDPAPGWALSKEELTGLRQMFQLYDELRK